MPTSKEAIILIGSGNISQYLTEEFLLDDTYDLHVISRTPRPFFEQSGLTFHKIESYTVDTILPLLDSTSATAIISTLQSSDPYFYNSTHESLLTACQRSKTCKRFVSSEYMGNLRDLPQYPRGNYYARQPFRLKLAAQTEIQHTLICQGWLADYFVQPPDGSKSYVRPFPEGWPIDAEQRKIRITGTGDEKIAWTATRDMAKAVVKLMGFGEWPEHTYVFGEYGTWNEAVGKLEKFLGRNIEREYRTEEEMERDLLQTSDRELWYRATMDEWSMKEGTAVPYDEAMRQREKYFADVHFRTLDEVLADSKTKQIL